MKAAGLSLITLSTDEFHKPYIDEQRVLNVIKACKIVDLEVRLQFVSTRSTSRLADFLRDNGDTLLNLECREIPWI